MSDEKRFQRSSRLGRHSLGWATLGGPGGWRCHGGCRRRAGRQVEGDAATPAGTFPLRRIYFRNDRLVPAQGRPAGPADQNEHDGWCDDPRSTAYNRAMVRIPNDWSHEKMWREDGSMTSSSSWATTTTAEGDGAAHLPPYRRRRLCTDARLRGLRRDDLLELVTLIGPQTRLNVLSIPGRRNRTARQRRTAQSSSRISTKSDW